MTGLRVCLKYPFIIIKTMRNKKGQVMGIRELILTLVLAGLLFIVGVLIFANVTNVTETILDPDRTTIKNETFTITIEELGVTSNTTTLSRKGVIANTDIVINVSGDQIALIRNTDYRITLFDGSSGELTTQANFTLINLDDPASFNNSLLGISYDVNTQSAAQVSTGTIQTTVLDSFSLGVIALIVLAAVVILAILFRLGQ